MFVLDDLDGEVRDLKVLVDMLVVELSLLFGKVKGVNCFLCVGSFDKDELYCKIKGKYEFFL